MDYQALKNGTATEEDVKQFEKALYKAFTDYNVSGQRTVDSFEDNPMELAYAKGFLAGAEWANELTMELLQETLCWNDMSEDDKAEFFQHDPFKIIDKEE